MSDKQAIAIAKEADRQIESEKQNEMIGVVKAEILKTLEKIEEKNKIKNKIEDEIRILKKDLEDLRSGKFDKIIERQEKSLVAKDVGVEKWIIEKYFYPFLQPYYHDQVISNNTAGTYWLDATSGTYTLTASNKVYYF